MTTCRSVTPALPPADPTSTGVGSTTSRHGLREPGRRATKTRLAIVALLSCFGGALGCFCVPTRWPYRTGVVATERLSLSASERNIDVTADTSSSTSAGAIVMKLEQEYTETMQVIEKHEKKFEYCWSPAFMALGPVVLTVATYQCVRGSQECGGSARDSAYALLGFVDCPNPGELCLPVYKPRSPEWVVDRSTVEGTRRRESLASHSVSVRCPGVGVAFPQELRTDDEGRAVVDLGSAAHGVPRGTIGCDVTGTVGGTTFRKTVSFPEERR